MQTSISPGEKKNSYAQLQQQKGSGHRRGWLLGSHLCNRLLADGHDVICVDNFFNGTKDIFNTYGPNMHPNDGRVVSNFIIQALQNKPITIYGDGSQNRSSSMWTT